MKSRKITISGLAGKPLHIEARRHGRQVQAICLYQHRTLVAGGGEYDREADGHRKSACKRECLPRHQKDSPLTDAEHAIREKFLTSAASFQPTVGRPIFQQLKSASILGFRIFPNFTGLAVSSYSDLAILWRAGTSSIFPVRTRQWSPLLPCPPR